MLGRLEPLDLDFELSSDDWGVSCDPSTSFSSVWPMSIKGWAKHEMVETEPVVILYCTEGRFSPGQRG